MTDIEKTIKGLTNCTAWDGLHECQPDCPYDDEADCTLSLVRDAVVLIKEQEAEIRQLRLALDIAKGTCKGIKSGGGQFADMPTMQSAT